VATGEPASLAKTDYKTKMKNSSDGTADTTETGTSGGSG
jgi:hypothetical protein